MAPDADGLVQEADALLSKALRPGTHPRESTIARFEEGGDLERVLALYLQAMRLEPTEPAYPWNLASSMARLRQYSLALAFAETAITVARETGDLEWADTYAHLAWADIAMRARQPEVALVALALALSLADDEDARRDVLQMAGKIEGQRESVVGLRSALMADLQSLIA